MANFNKMNAKQKEVMILFMSEHSDLAKNVLPSCAQAKSTMNRLWDELTKKLNAEGPPTKTTKLWKKAYSDLKYNAKKKLNFNKASKRRTGGGPYEEKTLTAAEDLLVEAAGLEACVEGNRTVPSFGIRSQPLARSEVGTPSTKSSTVSQSSKNTSPVSSTSTTPVASPSRRTPVASPSQRTPVAGCSRRTPAEPRRTPNTRTYKKKKDSKTVLLEQNLKAATEYQQVMNAKFDALLEINRRQVGLQERRLEIEERKLRIKEEQHRTTMAAREVDYQIKCLELQNLKDNINQQ